MYKPRELVQLRGASIEIDSFLEQVRGRGAGWIEVKTENQPEQENKSKKEKRAGVEGHGPM